MSKTLRDLCGTPPIDCHIFCEFAKQLRGYVGGQAYRDWYSCIYYEGVLFGFHNHKWFVRFSSDPKAKVKSGCQNSRAFGDGHPKLINAYWVSISDIPEDVHGKIAGIICDYIDKIHHLKRQKDELEYLKLKEELEKKRKEKEKSQSAWRKHFNE